MRKKWILVALIIAVALGVVVWGLSGVISSSFLQTKSKVVEINIWGFGEDEEVIKALLPGYLQAHPNVKVNFIKQTLINYAPRLQAQLQSGKGPDIFPIHSSWRGMLSSDLATAPQAIYPLNEFNSTQYPLIKETFVEGNRIYGVPYEMDGLALYYNPEILKGVSPNPPKTWVEFIDFVRKTTVKNQAGQIVTAGAAIGAANNVDNWSELMGAFFYQQPNGSLSNPANKDGAEVLQFLTSFAIDPRNKTWDSTLPRSLDLFSQGRLTFYFGDNNRIGELKALNPSLNFKIAPLPQLSSKQAAWGSYWGYAVSKRSVNQEATWELVRYLTSPATLQTVNQLRAQLGLSPRVYPVSELANLQLSDPNLAAFILQAPYYKSGYLNSSLDDGGVNAEMVELYKTALNNVLQGSEPLAALQKINPGVQEVLRKYNSK